MILLVEVKAIGKEHLLLNHQNRVVARLPVSLPFSPLADRDFGQANILHDDPDDRQTARLGSERVRCRTLLNKLSIALVLRI